jgi:curved DNA-binding protein CbpA
MAVNPILIAQKVLELIEGDDYEGILNIAASSPETCINKKSDHAAMRKLYLKLSLMIHPDKLGKSFPDATKAFQALVKSFEYLTAPDLIEEEQQEKGRGKKQKVPTISRSNDNCFRTRVCCPRCKQPWSEGSLDGNPDYYYNFLMSGLKQYLCSTCLCEFGCMTAVHKCPHCKRQFEYNPSDYHKQINCGHNSCTKKFGFYLFPASDRVMTEMKLNVKQEQEQRLRAREAKQRRAARSNRGTPLTAKEQERSFMMGLSDVCPRCGEDFTEMEDEEEQRRHLMECVDEKKHKEFAVKKAATAQLKEKKEAQAAKQESAQTHAAWQFLGANNEQLWLLEDDQLRSHAQGLNLDASGDSADLIGRIVKSSKQKEEEQEQEQEMPKRGRGKQSSSLLLTDGSTTGSKRKVDSSSALVSSSKAAAKRNKKIETMPTNLHSMSAKQLRAICASNDLMHLIDSGMSKADLLDVLENEYYGQPTSQTKDEQIMDLTIEN